MVWLDSDDGPVLLVPFSEILDVRRRGSPVPKHCIELGHGCRFWTWYMRQRVKGYSVDPGAKEHHNANNQCRQRDPDHDVDEHSVSQSLGIGQCFEARIKPKGEAQSKGIVQGVLK